MVTPPLSDRPSLAPPFHPLFSNPRRPPAPLAQLLNEPAFRSGQEPDLGAEREDERAMQSFKWVHWALVIDIGF